MQDGIDFLKQEYKKGLTIPSALKEFRIKILNEKLSGYSGETYIDYQAWKKCEIDKVELSGKEVVISVDASLTTDLTAINIMYKKDGIYYLIAHAFLPKNTLSARREKIDYRQMERLGYCTITKGDIVDYNLLEDFIRGIESKYNCTIKCIVTDPFNITATMQKLAEDYEVILLKQSYSTLSPSIKQFRDDVYLHKVRYEKNSLLDWCMSNTTTVIGRSSGDILLNKVNKNKSRIDLTVAAVFAYSQLYLTESKIPEITEDYINNFYNNTK
jgi:phage terminase large subunit-like protein